MGQKKIKKEEDIRMTNGDKIRNMTDKELAVLINACDNYLCSDCPYYDKENDCIRRSAYTDNFERVDNSEVEEWLKKEVE